jgi:hypothetical protein
MEPPAAVSGTLRLIDLRHIFDGFLEQASNGLSSVVENAPSKTDVERCQGIANVFI